MFENQNILLHHFVLKPGLYNINLIFGKLHIQTDRTNLSYRVAVLLKNHFIVRLTTNHDVL